MFLFAHEELSKVLVPRSRLREVQGELISSTEYLITRHGVYMYVHLQRSANQVCIHTMKSYRGVH